MTDCISDSFDVQDLDRRKLQADFSGGILSNEGGLLLISELDQRFRDQRRDAHSVEELLRHRLYGLVAGYEDLNDHELLRRDPLMAAVVGKADPLGENRIGEDKGNPLAGKATLNGLEVTNAKTDDGAREKHYHKIHANHKAIEKTLIELGVDSLPENTEEVILDFDATDELIHGEQEGRFYNGYYRNYCYPPRG